MRYLTFLAALLVLLGCRQPLRVTTDANVKFTPPPVSGDGPLREMLVRGQQCAPAKVAVLDVDGLLANTDMVGLYSQGENPVALFREKLDRIGADPCVCAVVVRINTHGGGVTASDIMWRDLLAFKSRRPVPVVAALMDVSTGGGYYLATAADAIVAHPTTITGGMGVIINLYNLRDLMSQFNIFAAPVKAGANTDLGTPVREMDEASRKILQQMADEFHARYRQVVEQTRPEYAPQKEDFDGRIFTAQQALDKRLIDSIGYLDDAIAMAKQMAGLPAARVVVYHRETDPARNVYAITPNMPIQTTVFPLSIPGLERTKLPTFLYIWQPEPTVERVAGR